MMRRFLARYKYSISALSISPVDQSSRSCTRVLPQEVPEDRFPPSRDRPVSSAIINSRQIRDRGDSPASPQILGDLSSGGRRDLTPAIRTRASKCDLLGETFAPRHRFLPREREMLHAEAISRYRRSNSSIAKKRADRSRGRDEYSRRTFLSRSPARRLVSRYL